MSTSGLYNFNPSVADLYLESFSRCEIEPPAIDRSKVRQATRSLGYLFVSWSNRGVNLWARDLQTINLAAGVTDYPVDPATMAVLDVYYSQVNGGGPGVDQDRIMTPMGETGWAEIPNKLLAGTPTRYWFEKLAVSAGTLKGGAATQPLMHIWQPPIASQVAPTYLVKFWRLRRLQDAQPTMGQQPDVHYRALDVLAAELAVRLAVKYKPEKYQLLKAEAEEAWTLFAETDRDDAPLTVMPQLSSYWRT